MFPILLYAFKAAGSMHEERGAGNGFQGGHLTKSKVPAGKWKGVTVAVKIVEHSAETEGELLQLRESLLSSSIVHPNVVRLSNNKHVMLMLDAGDEMSSFSPVAALCSLTMVYIACLHH